MAYKVVSVDEFLANVQSRPVEPFTVNGMTLEIRPLSMEERRQITRQATNKGEVDGIKATNLTVIYGVENPRLDRSHLIALNEAHGGIVDAIARRIAEISGIRTDDMVSTDAAAVDDAEGN